MAETYSLYWGTAPGSLSLIASGLEDLSFPMPVEGVLGYNTIYYWRVDATNQYGTTQGDVWYFTTIVFTPPIAPYVLVPEEEGGNQQGPSDDPPGIEGEDWNWTGTSFMAVIKRLVAVAKNAVYYEI